MSKKMLKSNIVNIFITSVISILSIFMEGCAATWPPVFVSDSYFLSEHFDENIGQEIIVVDVIDAITNNEKALKYIDGYEELFVFFILNNLKEKNYIIHRIEADNSSCLSIRRLQDLSCFQGNTILNKEVDLVFLISIDQYTPPEFLTVDTYIEVSGGLFSRNLQSFIWKDTIREKWDHEVDMFGPGALVVHEFTRVISPEKIYLDAAFSAIFDLLWTFPPFIRGNKYEKQIESLVR